VSEALRAFHHSPFDHADGPDGPNDADDDTAAASIYAAECYLSGDTQPACSAAERAIDAAFNIAQKELQLDSNEFRWAPTAEPPPLAKESMHPAVQAELRKQLAALVELEQGGVTSANLKRMRDCDL
jgi:hypothetical protein